LLVKHGYGFGFGFVNFICVHLRLLADLSI